VSNFELATCGHERRTQYPAHHRNESYAIRGGRARSATRVIVAEGEEVWRLVSCLLNGVPSHGYDPPGLDRLKHRVKICAPGAWHPDLFSGDETFDVGGAPRKLLVSQTPATRFERSSYPGQSTGCGSIRDLARRSSQRGSGPSRSQRYALQHTSSTVLEATVTGHMLTTTEITIGGKHSDGRPLHNGMTRGKPSRDLGDRSVVGDGSAR
jgi:hypothetical protein